MIRKLLLVTVLLLASTSLFAAQEIAYVIPAAGSGPGANGSLWRSEVTFHNAGDIAVTIDVQLHGAEGPIYNNGISIRPHRTATASNIVKNELLQENAFGAIIIKMDPILASRLALTSRAINESAAGEFGQDIPVIPVSQAFTTGERVVIAGPAKSSEHRFNFGLFPLEETSIDWSVYRKEGELATSKSVTYEAGKHVQYNGGIANFFGIEAQDNDVVVAKITGGKVFLYGSIVNNLSGDPSFVPGVVTRTNITARFLGVDIDENGSIDFADANGDNVLDEPLVIYTGAFPNFFKLMAEDPEGETLTFELVGASNDVRLFPDHTVQWLPATGLRGTEGTLVVRVNDGTDSVDFTIPVLFR